MPLTLDFSSDPTDIWDNPEVVTLVSVAPNSADDLALPITTSIRQALTKRELAASNGFYVGQDVHWFLAGKLLYGVAKPKTGDRIIAQSDNSEWTILDLTYEDLDQVYDCNCRNFALVHQLTSAINILTPIVRQDAALGRIVTAMMPKTTGVPARIQEIAARTITERGRRLQEKTYQVFCGRRVEVSHEELVEDAAGNRYEFVSSESPDRIDLLQVLTVRRTGDE